MSEGLNGYWLEIIFGLISALIMWIIHRLSSEVNKYKKLLDKKENEELEKTITEKLKPIHEDIKAIREQMATYDLKARHEVEQNMKYYAILLQDDCEYYVSRGYVTHKEFNRLAELLHIYEELGGDGKIHDLYHKVLNLPVRGPEETKKEGDSK